MFFERLQFLCAQNKKDVSNVLKALELSTSKGTAWKGGAMPKGDVLIKLADYFKVSVDYLLGRTDDPSPIGQKETPADDGGLSDVEAELFTEFRALPASHKGLAASLCVALIRELVRHQTIVEEKEVFVPTGPGR